MANLTFLSLLGVLTFLLATLWQPLHHRATVLGFLKSYDDIVNIHGVISPVKIQNTVHCEDLHYHAASNKLYAACEGNKYTRAKWFPPLGHFESQERAGQGKLVVIDPQTLEATDLRLSGFTGPLVTHGIDLLDNDDGQTITIFAINHLPNPDFGEKAIDGVPAPKSRSQVEVFTHVVGSDTAVWVRSVRHELIRTPNDLFATSPTSFYVTNDHHYREGSLRFLEDLLEYNTGAWSDVVHVEFSSESGVTVTTAVARQHNPNGLGHTPRPHEVMLCDASGGELFIMERDLDPYAPKALRAHSRIQVDSMVDNPSYYLDRYATPDNNASGYVLAGLALARTVADAVRTIDEPIPAIVWHVREDGDGKLKKNAIFQDNGKLLRSASAAVLVGIDPVTNGGRKQAWLFATGFVSEAIIATKVDL